MSRKEFVCDSERCDGKDTIHLVEEFAGVAECLECGERTEWEPDWDLKIKADKEDRAIAQMEARGE